MAKGNKRKYKQAYYAQAGKKFKGEHLLSPGQKGFLVTCNGNEVQALNETYNLLNDYADKLYGEIEDVAECDVEDELQKELDSIKKKVETKQFRFRQVRTGARNVVFVRMYTNDSPNELIDAILKDVEKTANPNSRGIARITPVANTCTAKIETIVAEFSKLAKQYFDNENNLKFKILFKQRNSNCLSKEIVFREVSKTVSALDKGHSCQFDDSDIVLNFEVIKSVCCISILRNYARFRKYNIQEVAKQAKTPKHAQDEDKGVKESADGEKSFEDDVEEEEGSETSFGGDVENTEHAGEDCADGDVEITDHTDDQRLCKEIQTGNEKDTMESHVDEKQKNDVEITDHTDDQRLCKEIQTGNEKDTMESRVEEK